MGLRTRPYLFVAVCLVLVSDLPQTRSECVYDEAKTCLLGKKEQISESICSKQSEFTVDVISCKDPFRLQGCSSEQNMHLDNLFQTILATLDKTCSQQKTTTPKPTEEPPLPECGSQEGWQYANQHITDCRKNYDRLSKFEYTMKLTKYGICKNSQELLDCMLQDKRFRTCQVYLDAFYRELIPHIKFAHLFDCQLTLDGKPVANPNENYECPFWTWLACHDHLFSELDGLGPVTEDFDLNAVFRFNVPSVTRALAQDKAKCSEFAKIDWSAIDGCRAKMSDRCSMLETPHRDSLWNGVLGLMYELTTQVYDKITFLMSIKDICADGCDDIITKTNKIDNECKAGVRPEDIIDRFNSGQEAKDLCTKLEDVKSCLHNKVIGECDFLEQSVVKNLHLDNNWVIAFDICKIDLEVKSEGRCPAEQETANKVINDCSFQTNANKRESLLKDDTDATYFCAYLQSAADCYAPKVLHCSALERKYWLAELPLMAAANQMIPQCHVSYSTNGNTKLLPIDPNTCNMKDWVQCLDSLWSALGVQNSDGNLSLDGFKALLRMTWNHGNRNEQIERCRKVKDVDFDAIENCTKRTTMSCQFPMLTLPAAEEPALELRNPFDFGQLKTFVMETCKPSCTDTDPKDNFEECIDVSGSSALLNLYPKDIIANAYRGLYDIKKCNNVKRVKACIDYYLDPNKCILFRNDIVHTSAFLEAVTTCRTRKSSNNKPTETSTGGKVVTSVITVLLSILFVAVVKPLTSSMT